MNLGSLYCLEVGALQKCLPNRCAGLSACIGAGAVSGLAGLAHSWACSFPVKALRSIYPANGTANLRHLGLDIAADLKLAAHCRHRRSFKKLVKQSAGHDFSRGSASPRS